MEKYEIIDVGTRAKNLIGQQFGDYICLNRVKLLERTTDHTYWLCQCVKCKKMVIKNSTMLKPDKLNQCECHNDLTGKQIGRWTVQYECEKRTKKRGRLYHCKCECGNEKDVPAETLRRGQSQSCGCITKERMSELGKRCRIDITGERYGKLVALYPIYSKRKDRHTFWHCKCDCGNEVNIDLGNLRQGFSKSCGCTQSHNEENIIKLLTKHNIPFIYQHRFKDMATKEFDFYINNKYIIEFDGQQHFTPSNSGWDTQEYFKRTRKSDLLKNKYCFEHNIPLIRIPYDCEYGIDDLKLETTNFLLTPENEQEYYNSRNNFNLTKGE